MREVLDPQPRDLIVKRNYTIFVMETEIADQDMVDETRAYIEAATKPAMLRIEPKERIVDTPEGRVTRHVLEWRAYFVHRPTTEFIPLVNPRGIDPR